MLAYLFLVRLTGSFAVSPAAVGSVLIFCKNIIYGTGEYLVKYSTYVPHIPPQNHDSCFYACLLHGWQNLSEILVLT